MPERAWSLARQNSGADAALAAAAAAGKRPSLRIVPAGNSAPPGQRRVWVRRRGTTHATSVLVDSDELVDDLKTKVLNRFPTTLLRLCDPADLIFALPDDVARVRSVSPNVKKELHPNWQSPTAYVASGTQNTSHTGTGTHSGSHAGSAVGASGASASTASTTSSSAPSATSAPTTPGKAVELQPEEQIVPLIDRYFPQGMTVTDALDVYTVNECVPAMPAVPIPTRQFKFRANPPTPNQRPGASRVNSYVDQNQQPQSSSTPTSSVPAQVQAQAQTQAVPAAQPTHPSSALSRSASRSRSISRGRPRESRQSPKPLMQRSESVASQSKDSGVLLLPRQFRIPNDHLERDVDEANEESLINGDGESAPGMHGSARDSISGPSGGGDGTEIASANGTTTTRRSAPSLEVSLTHLSPNTRSVNEKVIVPHISVLIVEDNVINQKILEAFMRRKSVCYAIAKNGKEAVSMWRQGGFHLILMDIQLPVMTGLEATKEIRRLEHVNRIGAFSHSTGALEQKSPEDELIGKFKSPVIIVALTASSASKDKSEALAAGCNDFLTKPVNLLWLEQKILEWGCMQALIDFDGWKQWIRKSLDDGRTPSPAQSLTSTTAPPETQAS